MKGIWYYDEVFSRHNPGAGHPENAQRLSAIQRALEKSNLSDKLLFLPCPEVEESHVFQVHEKTHVQSILATRGKTHRFDGDTCASPDTVEALLKASGAVTSAVDQVIENKDSFAFCALRPPGHHATASRAMGFCFFNHVAIAAHYAIQKHGCKRVLIFDPDVHHGNGTQDIFYHRDDVLYISIHQSPFYPGTGSIDEMGQGAGKGYNINLPLPLGQGDEEYLFLSQNVLIPVIQKYKPDLIIFSAGFDAHAQDPLGQMNLTSQGFLNLYSPIIHLAQERKIPFFFALEGGYSPQALSESITLIVENLLNDNIPKLPVISANRHNQQIMDYLSENSDLLD